MEYATAALNEMRIAAKAIGRMVDVARKDSSVEEVICLSTRLTSIRALLQVSEGADRALRDALAIQDNNKGNHEFRKIAVALTKTRQLVSESERCASDNVLRSGETSIQWKGGLESPEDDTADLETDLLDLGIDPPEVSPFL